MRLLIFLPAILIPACASSIPAFLMMSSAYMLNKQGDNIQPWHTPFPICNQSVVPRPVLTVWFLSCIQASQEAGQVVWYSHLFQKFPQFTVIHTVKSFGIVNEAEIDVFLELSCFFDDPTDAGNLISGSSAFSKTSLNIWKFTVQVLLKPGLENFKHHYNSIPGHIYGEDMIQKDTCIPVFIIVLFTIAKTWKKPKCPSTEDWLKKMWYVYVYTYIQWNIT